MVQLRKNMEKCEIRVSPLKSRHETNYYVLGKHCHLSIEKMRFAYPGPNIIISRVIESLNTRLNENRRNHIIPHTW